MSIRIAPDRTSLRTVLKCVVLLLLGSTDNVVAFGAVAPSSGIGGAGTVGGFGADNYDGCLAVLDAEAPGTYPGETLARSFPNFGSLWESLGAVAPRSS